MGGADVDQACFFASGNDLDRKAERFFGQRQELVSVLGNAQGIGRHGADSALVQSAQPFAKTP